MANCSHINNTTIKGTSAITYDSTPLPCTDVDTCNDLNTILTKFDNVICSVTANVTLLTEEITNLTEDIMIITENIIDINNQLNICCPTTTTTTTVIPTTTTTSSSTSTTTSTTSSTSSTTTTTTTAVLNCTLVGTAEQVNITTTTTTTAILTTTTTSSSSTSTTTTSTTSGGGFTCTQIGIYPPISGPTCHIVEYLDCSGNPQTSTVCYTDQAAIVCVREILTNNGAEVNAATYPTGGICI